MTNCKDTAIALGEDVETSRKIIESAFDKGILSRTRRLSASTLPPSKVMIKAGGKDIVKKSTNRKGRYILVFNCQLAPAAAGKLGTLSKLDTKNPVMYIDFPNGGRLKLFGTLLFPKNKYLVMKMGHKEVICEDILESMIVFNESWWVGTEAENPDEHQLPWPSELSTTKVHDKFEYQIRTPGGGGKQGEDGADNDEEDNDDDGDDDEDEDNGDGGEGLPTKGGKMRAPAQQRRADRPTRAGAAAAGGRSGKKRPRYAEDSDEINDTSDSSDDNGEEIMLPTQSQKAPLSSRSKPKSAAKKKNELVVVDNDDDNIIDLVDNEPPSKQGTLLSFLNNSNNNKKKRTDDDDGEEEECKGSDDDDDEEEEMDMDESSEESDYAPSE